MVSLKVENLFNIKNKYVYELKEDLHAFLHHTLRQSCVENLRKCALLSGKQ